MVANYRGYQAAIKLQKHRQEMMRNKGSDRAAQEEQFLAALEGK